MKTVDLISPTGQALLRAYGCPVCGNRDAACGSLRSATPEPGLWCPHLEDALETRDWRQWARQYLESERHHSPGYRAYQQQKFERLRREQCEVDDLDQ